MAAAILMRRFFADDARRNDVECPQVTGACFSNIDTLLVGAKPTPFGMIIGCTSSLIRLPSVRALDDSINRSRGQHERANAGSRNSLSKIDSASDKLAALKFSMRERKSPTWTSSQAAGLPGATGPGAAQGLVRGRTEGPGSSRSSGGNRAG